MKRKDKTPKEFEVITERDESERLDQYSELSNYPTVADSRVIHDSKQVKSPSELVVGGSYEVVYATGENCPLKITSIDNDNGRFRALSESGFSHEDFFEDLGLIPYDNGKWNSSNYIIPAREE